MKKPFRFFISLALFLGAAALLSMCGDGEEATGVTDTGGADGGGAHDAGAPDAGAHDAGSLDAGPDTGLPDSGIPEDAGAVPDSGMPADGGPATDTGLDAGKPDGGLPADAGADAGKPDGGQIADAGADAGPATDGGFPHYFIAIHNEPYHNNPNADTLRAQSYTILKGYVDKATPYGIRLTLMFSAQLADYIVADSGRQAEVSTWKSKGHEFAIHHHSIYHGSWDGYTWYSQADAAWLRACQGKTGEQYLGDLDDFMAKVSQLSTGVKSGCAADEDDRKELPDAIIYDTCAGFANFGAVGTRSENDGSPEAGRNDYFLTGTVRGIERHWLDHFICSVDTPAAETQFNSMGANQVYGTIFHSNSNDQSAFNTFVDFLHSKDVSGSGSRTLAQVVEEGLLPGHALDQADVDTVNNTCVAGQDGGYPDGGSSDGGLVKCTDGGGCPPQKVCCTTGVCAGDCVPDCRFAGYTCPPQAPNCDSQTGLCKP